MKNNGKRFWCAALCLTLLLTCIGIASAAGKRNQRLTINLLGDLMDDWYYVTDTVPPEYLNQEKAELHIYTNDGSDLPSEDATSCEITFKKGDEALKNALVAEQDENGKWYAYVDNNALTAAGTASFHFKAESDSFVYERDYTIHVLDWNEHPLLEAEHDHPVVTASIGQAINDNYLMSLIGTVYTDDIFSNVLKLKTRSFMASDYFIPRSNTDVEITGEGLVRQYDPSYLINRYYTLVKDYGEHEVRLIYQKGNIRAAFPMTISVKGYKINADVSPAPGGTVRFQITGSTQGRTFTWTVDGEGATINPESGEMSIAPEAPVGTVYTVTATSNDGDEVSTKMMLSDGLFSGTIFRHNDGNGFSLPEPVGGEWVPSDEYYNQYYRIFFQSENRNQSQRLQLDARFYTIGDDMPGGFAEDQEAAADYMEKKLSSEYDAGTADYATEIIDIDGHPAKLEAFSVYDNGSLYANLGIIWYPRNTLLARYRVFSIPTEGTAEEDVPKVTIDDLKTLAYQFGYDESNAPFSRANAAITVTAKDNATTVTAGKNIQFSAAFADTNNINKKNKNDTVSWIAVNAQTGEEEPAVSISNKGQLKVEKSLAAPVELEIKAISEIYGTEGTCRVTAMPVVSKVNVEPAELFFYVGTDDPQTVKATLEPDTVPPIGLTWTSAKQGVAEISETEDGVVSIRPLTAGKTTVTVKEPGGKSAKLNVNVVEPVKLVELSLKGKVQKGGNVTVGAALDPKNPGNKSLEWSLDVGEDIATISDKGQVKISKDVPSGTKITVTCKALGAPEPVVSTIEIEIP